MKQRLTKLEGGPPGLNISLPGPSTSGNSDNYDDGDDMIHQAPEQRATPWRPCSWGPSSDWSIKWSRNLNTVLCSSDARVKDPQLSGS